MNDIAQKIQSSSPDQATIIINNTRIEHFFNESILLSIDNLGSGFSFDIPFFPGTQQYRDIFKPFKYQDFQMYIGENLKINGTVEKITPSYDSNSSILNIQGRSKTGVLVDCSFEKSDTKEFKKADLEEIAKTVVDKFGIETSFPDGAGAIFEQAGPDSPITKIFDFLQNLARQRSLLIGQTNDGKLLFRKAKVTGNPVAELIEGQQGIIISTAAYDSTKRFSKYDIFGQEPGRNDNFSQLLTSLGKEQAPEEPTAQDLIDSSIFAIRPKSLSANDTNQGNIEDAVKWTFGSDLAESINIPMSHEGWLRPDGKLWSENELILVQAPSLMIYKPFVMLIKSVLFRSSPTEKITDFELSLPQAYTGEVPEVFPWD